MNFQLDADALWICVDKRWSPVIGDPTVMGWVTVAGYLLAALLCFTSASRRYSGLHVFWSGLGLLMLALALNKQLDLQSALTAIGRCISQLQGWYDDRRVVQREFIVALLFGSAVFAVGLFWFMRRRMASVWLALLGICFLLTFISVRAIGFHHFDEVINMRVNNVRMNWVLELGGIAMIAMNALVSSIRPRLAPRS